MYLLADHLIQLILGDYNYSLLNRDVSARPLLDADRAKIKRALRGVKVGVTRRGSMHRKYMISGLTSQAARELMFPVDDPRIMKSVVSKKPLDLIFSIPLDLACKLVTSRDQIVYQWRFTKLWKDKGTRRRLDKKQITALLGVTCQRPEQRELDIIAYHDGPWILPVPWLKNH